MPNTTPTNWHQTPTAQRLLARLNPANVKRVKQLAIPNDFYVYRQTDDLTYRTLAALEEIRAVSIDEAFGATFVEAEAGGRALDYIAAMDAAPTLYDAINGAFSARRAVAA